MLAQLANRPELEKEGWVTLQEASNAAGVSPLDPAVLVPRRSDPGSRLVAGTHGPQRMVPLEAVVDRALRSLATLAGS